MSPAAGNMMQGSGMPTGAVSGNGGSGGTAAGGGGMGASAGTGSAGNAADAGTVSDGSTDDDAASDAGESDPLSTVREGFWGDSRCDALDALFCDGFEGTQIDAAWQKQGPGSATIDSSQQARGASSLHVHTEGNGFAYLRLRSIFPLAGNRYYARMFVRFDALPTAPDWAHWTFAEAAGSGDGSLIRVGGQWDRERNRFGVGSDGGPTGDWTNLDRDPGGSALTTPQDEWLCIEWLHDGDADVTRFFWDAVEHPSLATSASAHGGSDAAYVMPEFESVWVGWWLYQGNPTPSSYDIWIDEVAFDDERIGCVR
jgi:hypothetical protein